MSEILQDCEEYILQWYDTDLDKWGSSWCITYDDAVKKMEEYKSNDKTCGDNFKYRVIKETIKNEVVYNEL